MQKFNGGDLINTTTLLLMMMMGGLNNKSTISLEIETYDGQTKDLQFDDIVDLELFLDTDFEVTAVHAPDEDLSKIRTLLKNQEIMDISRNAYINIEKRIRNNSNPDGSHQRDTEDRNTPKVYDFNIHEKDIQVI